MPDVGSRIRALRKLRKLSQQDVGDRLGINQSTVSDIERGAAFSAEILFGLTEMLQTTARYIMRGDSDSDLYESELLAMFRALSEDDRTAILRTMRGMVSALRVKTPFKSTR